MTPNERQRLEALAGRLAEEGSRLDDVVLRLEKSRERLTLAGISLKVYEVEYKLRALAAEAGWISVEDRLPEEGQWVLVIWRSGTSDRYKHMDVARYWHESKRWSSEITRTIQVTHWQPLPPPPKPEAGRAEE